MAFIETKMNVKLSNSKKILDNYFLASEYTWGVTIRIHNTYIKMNYQTCYIYSRKLLYSKLNDAWWEQNQLAYFHIVKCSFPSYTFYQKSRFEAEAKAGHFHFSQFERRNVLEKFLSTLPITCQIHTDVAKTLAKQLFPP